MYAGTLGRSALLLFAGVTILYNVRYWYRSTNRVSQATGILIILGMSLLAISTAAAVQHPSTLILRLVTVAAFHQSILLLHFSLVQLIETDVKPFYTTKLYLGVTVLSMVNLGLEWVRRDNLGSFIDNEVYRPDAVYFASYMLFYALWFMVGVKTLPLVRRFMHQNTGLTYRLRGATALGAWSLIVVCALIEEINLGLSLVIGDVYRADLNALYHALKAPVGLLAMLGAAPTPFFVVAARPVDGWMKRRQAKHTQLINALHAVMIQIAPRVHLPNEALRDIRAPIEISDARDVIWSHYPRTQPITPQDEANLLRTLLHENVTLTTIGPYQPPTIDEVLPTHNLKVATLLTKREAS